MFRCQVAGSSFIVRKFPMQEKRLRYKLANQLIQYLKELVIVLHGISKDQRVRETLKQNIIGEKDGYIVSFNRDFISPFMDMSEQRLTQLVFSGKYSEYLDAKLREDFDENKFLLLARYCRKGLGRGLAEWWAPSGESQKNKDKAVNKVYHAALNYLEAFGDEGRTEK